MRRIQYRLLAIVISIGLIGMITPILYTNSLALDQAQEGILDKLRSHTNAILFYSNSSEKTTFQGLATEYSDASGLRVTLIAADGTVIGESSIPITELQQMDNHIERPEVLAAQDFGEGSSTRYSNTLKIEFIYFAKKVDQNYYGFKFIRLAQTLKSVKDLAGTYREFYYLIIAFIVLVIIVAWFLLKNWLTDPIRELTQAADDISKGDLSRRININTGGIEIDELAANMNQMAMKLDEDFRRIKRMEKVRSEFLGNVTHELKTPISSISGYIETLLEGAIKDENVNLGFLERSLENVQRLEELVTDLVEISRIETGELRMNFEYFNIHDLLNDLFKDAHQRNSNKTLKIQLEVPDKKLFIYGDKSRLDQVIANLLSNAMRYTDQGQIRIKVMRRDNELIFSIRDTGIGISRKALSRIFERFYRTDKARDRRKGGTGLGLAISKHIIEAHGSHIYVDSLKGKGSTFSFGITTISPE
ncbi:MAG TPA: sensor histidine kinase [Candidatus Marinimicrobia bacterium]|nr:sensor histidine kinase [Candidatus Neomarinimicrobiota bacterium]